MALRAHNGNANGRHEPYARPSSALPSGALAAVPTARSRGSGGINRVFHFKEIDPANIGALEVTERKLDRCAMLTYKDPATGVVHKLSNGLKFRLTERSRHAVDTLKAISDPKGYEQGTALKASFSVPAAPPRDTTVPLPDGTPNVDGRPMSEAEIWLNKLQARLLELALEKRADKCLLQSNLYCSKPGSKSKDPEPLSEEVFKSKWRCSWMSAGTEKYPPILNPGVCDTKEGSAPPPPCLVGDLIDEATLDGGTQCVLDNVKPIDYMECMAKNSECIIEFRLEYALYFGAFCGATVSVHHATKIANMGGNAPVVPDFGDLPVRYAALKSEPAHDAHGQFTEPCQYSSLGGYDAGNLALKPPASAAAADDAATVTG